MFAYCFKKRMRERDEDEASEPLVSCRPQTPPSHEEKLSGEPSQILGASAQFCASVT